MKSRVSLTPRTSNSVSPVSALASSWFPARAAAWLQLHRRRYSCILRSYCSDSPGIATSPSQSLDFLILIHVFCYCIRDFLISCTPCQMQQYCLQSPPHAASRGPLHSGQAQLQRSVAVAVRLACRPNATQLRSRRICKDMGAEVRHFDEASTRPGCKDRRVSDPST